MKLSVFYDHILQAADQMDCIGRSAAFLRSIDKTEKIV